MRKLIYSNFLFYFYSLKELSDVNNIDIAVKHKGIVKNGMFNPDHREPDYKREAELKRQKELKIQRYKELKALRFMKIRVNYIFIHIRKVII